MRVLFVGGGRRVSLAKRFIKAGFDIFSYETEANCPISLFGKVIKGKTWNDEKIETHLTDIARTCSIDLIIPLADQATFILSQISEKYPEFKNKIPTSSSKTNKICLNKKLFEKQFNMKEYYPNIKANSDVILKPIFGANSKGIKIISWYEYIKNIQEYNKHYVAQRFINDIENGMEISVDAYFNKNAKMIDAVLRQRIEVQGGEVNRSKTLPRNNFGIIDIIKSIGEEIGIVGPICAQFILEQNKPFLMEINSRLGGGVILSLEAGFDIIKLMKQEYVDNIECIPQNYNWKENFYMTRYFKEYFYENICN